MTPHFKEKQSRRFGTGLGLWAFLNTEKKPIGFMILCAPHAAKAIFKIEQRLATGAPPDGEIRLVRNYKIMAALRLDEQHGENACARCGVDDWESAEMWHGTEAQMAAFMGAGWGITPGVA